jgi:hypothetical protein
MADEVSLWLGVVGAHRDCSFAFAVWSLQLESMQRMSELGSSCSAHAYLAAFAIASAAWQDAHAGGRSIDGHPQSWQNTDHLGRQQLVTPAQAGAWHVLRQQVYETPISAALLDPAAWLRRAAGLPCDGWIDASDMEDASHDCACTLVAAEAVAARPNALISFCSW